MNSLLQIRSNFSLVPTSPGIYLYKDRHGVVLYVGKAKNLRNRIKSYFLDKKIGPKTQVLLSKASALDFIVVDSDFSALLLEASLINKFKPHYNIISKDDKSPLYIVFTDEKYPRIRSVRRTDLAKFPGKITTFGPFPSALEVKRLLKRLRLIFPFCESKGDKGKPCLHSHLGLCFPCPRQIEKQPHLSTIYKKNIRNLKSVLGGHIHSVQRLLEKDMSQAASSLDYEKAAQIRDQINSLQSLTTIRPATDEYLANPNLSDDIAHSALLSLQSALKLPQLPQRIECYDISHTGKDSATAAMVVAVNGHITNSQFRHFKIKHSLVPNDPAALKEVVLRRLKHPEWGIPDLLVLDGGMPQLSIVSQELSRTTYSHLPVVALAKKREEIHTLFHSQPLLLSSTDPGLRLLVSLRNEAHRFSRRLHHHLRSRSIFK